MLQRVEARNVRALGLDELEEDLREGARAQREIGRGRGEIMGDGPSASRTWPKAPRSGGGFDGGVEAWPEPKTLPTTASDAAGGGSGDAAVASVRSRLLPHCFSSVGGAAAACGGAAAGAVPGK